MPRVRELKALVSPKPLLGVEVRGHAGLVINRLSLGAYGDPRGVGVSHERGAPVPRNRVKASRRVLKLPIVTRWRMTLSSKLKLHHAIKLRVISRDEVAPAAREFWGERTPRSPLCCHLAWTNDVSDY